MTEKILENFSIAQICESGQCFRMEEMQDGRYRVIAGNRYLELEQQGNRVRFDCSEVEYQNFWRHYFDIETDYGAVMAQINPNDTYLTAAAQLAWGVRILNQDLWEMIVTFMISQNNNIKRITNSVDLLCRRCGHKIDGSAEGEELYTFPKPLEVPDEVFDDRSMGFGYRAPYLKEIYEYGANNPDWLDNLRKMSYDEAMESLLTRKGIGKKVANCICLFGLHHVDAFPIDTHVKQLLDKYYSDGFDFERYKGVAGIIQQYLFYFEL